MTLDTFLEEAAVVSHLIERENEFLFRAALKKMRRIATKYARRLPPMISNSAQSRRGEDWKDDAQQDAFCLILKNQEAILEQAFKTISAWVDKTHPELQGQFGDDDIKQLASHSIRWMLGEKQTRPKSDSPFCAVPDIVEQLALSGKLHNDGLAFRKLWWEMLDRRKSQDRPGWRLWRNIKAVVGELIEEGVLHHPMGELFSFNAAVQTTDEPRVAWQKFKTESAVEPSTEELCAMMKGGDKALTITRNYVLKLISLGLESFSARDIHSHVFPLARAAWYAKNAEPARRDGDRVRLKSNYHSEFDVADSGSSLAAEAIDEVDWNETVIQSVLTKLHQMEHARIVRFCNDEEALQKDPSYKRARNARRVLLHRIEAFEKNGERLSDSQLRQELDIPRATYSDLLKLLRDLEGADS